MARDNFKKATIDVLAKRVAYRCCNPKCGLTTIGPNDVVDKVTVIGEAAHITAASEGGPRFDPQMTQADRCSIENGIWLCSNCSDLIDKDWKAYPTPLLIQWRQDAENRASDAIKGIVEHTPIAASIPFLEVDLIWTGASRMPLGFSEKNDFKMEGDVRIIQAGNKYIQNWLLTWRLSFVIYNNSEFPAYNVKIEQVKGNEFEETPKLNKINNLPRFENVELSTKVSTFFEGYYDEADEKMRMRLPVELNGVELLVTYFDTERQRYQTLIQVHDQEIINTKIK